MVGHMVDVVVAVGTEPVVGHMVDVVVAVGTEPVVGHMVVVVVEQPNPPQPIEEVRDCC